MENDVQEKIAVLKSGLGLRKKTVEKTQADVVKHRVPLETRGNFGKKTDSFIL